MDASPTKVRALLLEDEPADRTLILEALRAQEVEVAGVFGALDDLIAALDTQDGSPDLVLADLNLPDSYGVFTVEALRDARPNLPIVVITGDVTAAANAIRAGADEVVTKDDLPHLVNAVTNSMQRASGSGVLGRAFQMADTPLVVVDRVDQVVMLNEAASGHLGIDAARRLSFPSLFAPEDRVEVASFLASMVDADGEKVWASARLHDADGAECEMTGRIDQRSGLGHVTLTIPN